MDDVLRPGCIRPLADTTSVHQGAFDASPSGLGYSRAIGGARSKTAAVVALAASAATAALLLGDGDGPLDAVQPARAAATLPVKIRLPVTTRLDLLSDGSVPLRLRFHSHARLLVAVRLRVAGERSTKLVRPRMIRVRPRRWKRVKLHLTPDGRSALGGCPVGDLVATARRRNARSQRTVRKALKLDAPACARFFGPSATWNSPLAPDAPLDPDSDRVTADLLGKVQAGDQSNMPPTINTTSYAPPVYTVPADQRRVPVRLDRGARVAPDLAAAFAAVPLPPDAEPAPGTDSELVVWQPSTDTMWEFWRLRRAGGGWVATWGGRLENASRGPGHFAGSESGWGTTASSLPLAGGMITPRELEQGHIDHALSLGVPHTRAGWFSLPAQRTDGDSRCPNAVPEGAHFRLDPTLNIDALHLPAAVATVARAAQRYGIFVRDQAGTVTFYAQSTVSLPTDPYHALFGGQAPYDLLKTFPWAHLQLVRMDLRRTPDAPSPLLGPLTGCS